MRVSCFPLASVPSERLIVVGTPKGEVLAYAAEDGKVAVACAGF